MVVAPSSTSLAGGGPARGLPRRATAPPQYAIPHEGSACSVASNPATASRKAKEWSNAAARENSFCAAGLHDVGKLTVPSFSGACWATEGRANRRLSRTAIAARRMVFLLVVF